jgi:GDP-L-fucose synthase
MEKNSRIFVAGHRGLVGSAVTRCLETKGYERLILRTREELDLTDQTATREFFMNEKPEYVFLCAAKVGGIGANSAFPADFIYMNLAISTNVIHGAYLSGVRKLINLGSSCIYPRLAPQPMKEEYLLTGSLERTNEPYAVAKIAAIEMCASYNRQYATDFLSVMPTNLYGPNDNYDFENSHVLAAMLSKMHEAKKKGGKVVLWGDGSPYREFLFSDDLADALVFLMENFGSRDIDNLVNIGTGKEISIRELAETIARVVGFDGEIEWDTTKPNGTPRKLLDVSRLSALGWSAKTGLQDGIRLAYEDFKRKE